MAENPGLLSLLTRAVARSVSTLLIFPRSVLCFFWDMNIASHEEGVSTPMYSGAVLFPSQAPVPL